MNETKCELYRRLDREYGTYKHSPLHHDNRCDCEVKA